MYEKIIVKTKKNRECCIKTIYYKLIRKDNETYLLCFCREFEAPILIPFDRVITITE